MKLLGRWIRWKHRERDLDVSCRKSLVFDRGWYMLHCYSLLIFVTCIRILSGLFHELTRDYWHIPLAMGRPWDCQPNSGSEMPRGPSLSSIQNDLSGKLKSICQASIVGSACFCFRGHVLNMRGSSNFFLQKKLEERYCRKDFRRSQGSLWFLSAGGMCSNRTENLKRRYREAEWTGTVWKPTWKWYLRSLSRGNPLQTVVCFPSI